MNNHHEIAGKELFEKIKAEALQSLDDMHYHHITDDDVNHVASNMQDTASQKQNGINKKNSKSQSPRSNNFNTKKKSVKGLDDLKTEAQNIHQDLINLDYNLDAKSICHDMAIDYEEYQRRCFYEENAYYCLIVTYLLFKNNNVKIQNPAAYHEAILFKPKKTMIQYLFHAVAKAKDKQEQQEYQSEKAEKQIAKQQLSQIIKIVDNQLKNFTPEEKNNIINQYYSPQQRPKLTKEQDYILVRTDQYHKYYQEFAINQDYYNWKIAYYFKINV